MDFSKRLKELREKNGLSQEQLADTLGIPRPSITHYESSDDRMPRQKRLNQIADFFGVTVDYLIGRSDTSELNKAEMHFLEDIDKLTPEQIILKHKPTLDGKPITKEQLEVAINIIRTMQAQ